MPISAWPFRSRAPIAPPRRSARTEPRRAFALAGLIVAAAAAPGCTSNDAALEPLESAGETQAHGDLLELVRYGNSLRGLDAAELADEYRRLILEGALRSGEGLVRLSLLTSMPSAPFSDQDRTARLLGDALERDRLRDPEHRELATLLYNLLSERIHEPSQAEILASLLGEERNRNEQLNEQLAQAREQLAAERERRRTLQEQLDALKRLEEQLSLEGSSSP